MIIVFDTSVKQKLASNTVRIAMRDKQTAMNHIKSNAKYFVRFLVEQKKREIAV